MEVVLAILRAPIHSIVRPLVRHDLEIWRATADEDGHLYEASPVKRFLRELRFLASQEACVCFHGVMVPSLAVLSRSSPNAPQGLRLWAQGLDGESTRRAIMVWAMSGLAGFSANELISPFVVRRSSVEVTFLFGPFDPRRSPY